MTLHDLLTVMEVCLTSRRPVRDGGSMSFTSESPAPARWMPTITGSMQIQVTLMRRLLTVCWVLWTRWRPVLSWRGSARVCSQFVSQSVDRQRQRLFPQLPDDASRLVKMKARVLAIADCFHSRDIADRISNKSTWPIGTWPIPLRRLHRKHGNQLTWHRKKLLQLFHGDHFHVVSRQRLHCGCPETD